MSGEVAVVRGDASGIGRAAAGACVVGGGRHEQAACVAHHPLKERAMGPEGEVTLSEALADPMVQALMAADHVDLESVKKLMHGISALSD